MTIRRRAAWSLVVVLGCWACDTSPPWPADLAPVEHPALEGVEETARHQLEEGRGELSALLGQGSGAPRELAAAFGAMGRLYHAYRLHDAAAACYGNARRLDPQSILWPYYLGLLEQTRGRFVEARSHFESVLELAPGNGPARLRLGEVLLSLAEPAAAEEHFAAVVEDSRYAAAAHAGLGRAGASAGAAQRAVEHFEKALELDPAAGSLHHPLGLALRRLGRVEDSAGHLGRKASGLVSFPDPLADQLADLAVSAGSYIRRANRALLNGRLDEAVEAYGRAVETEPDNVSARRNFALALVRQGDSAEALRQLEAARQTAPEDPQVHFDLGNVHRARKALGPAAEAYRRALELAPDHVAARFNLANVLAEQQRWEEAAVHLDQVLAAEPGHGRARYLAAMALNQQGRSEEAARRLAALVDEEPANVAAHRGLATVLVALGSPERALAAYHEALEMELPVNEKSALLAEAAQLAWRQGRRAEAISYFRRGVEFEPRSGEAHVRLANALQLHGKRREAAELFATATRLDPDNATAWLSEASLLILAGDYSRAVSRLGEALERLPGHVGLTHTLARLLATCPEARLRDGQRALVLAQSAYGAEKSLEHAATVGMALAELGRFEEAIRWQQSLVRQLAGRGSSAVARQLVAHLKLYESRRPVRIGESDP